jgi:hypothetical protein
MFSKLRTLSFDLRIVPVTLSVSVARLRTMPDFFSILLDEVSASVELVFGVVDQADNVVAEISGLIFLG